MADLGLEIHETFSPSTDEIDFLTEKINDESRSQNISCDAYPFGIFVRARTKASNKEDTDLEESSSPQMQLPAEKKLPVSKDSLSVGDVVGGCNGSIVYGSIYTDQLWVHSSYRGKGIGRMIMEKVHELGRQKQCTFATVGTMDFQHAQMFYEHLGYQVEFERHGYANGGKMIYLRKAL